MQRAKRLASGLLVGGIVAFSIHHVASSAVEPGVDKYAVAVPGGISLSEVKGYETWQAVSLSRNNKAVAVILANPTMVDAFRAGVPDNGKPFPDGSKMVKVHWTPESNQFFPDTTVPGALHDVDVMIKDAKRFADSGGWGYGAFEYHAESGGFTPATEADAPPQAHDAKCGFACHSVVAARDFVFTRYAPR